MIPIPFLAVLPYVRAPEGHLGPLPIHPFGVLVALGIVLGWKLAERWARHRGLDVQQLGSLIQWTVGTGLVVSHVFDTVFYHPELIVRAPWELLMIHHGLSSFGGFLGAALGFGIYVRRHGLEAWRYADAIAFGLPVGWFFGRMGCAVVHDHPGARSNSALAVAFPDGPRFDLGLLEMALTPLLIAAVWIVSRRFRRPGALVTTLALVYPLIRFPLDFLRAGPSAGGDVRYLGLTPAQYAAVALLLAGLWMYQRITASRPALAH